MSSRLKSIFNGTKLKQREEAFLLAADDWEFIVQILVFMDLGVPVIKSCGVNRAAMAHEY